MKKRKCYICQRDVIPSLSVQAKRYIPYKRKIFKGFGIKSESFTIFICEKCNETIKAMIVNNIAIKTSDIMSE